MGLESLTHSQSLQINRSRVLRVGMTQCPGQLEEWLGPALRFLVNLSGAFSLTPGQRGLFCQTPCGRTWDLTAGGWLHMGQRGHQSGAICGGRRATEEQEEHLIPVWEKETGPHGCQCRLNRRKWQVGYWESGRWGPGTKNNLCFCFLCMAVPFVTLVLKLLKNFAKKAPVFESGSCLGLAHQ